jgi:fumarylacetoacetase
VTDLNETHDPARRSWVESANSAATDFPIQNLPLGIFRAARGAGAPTVGVAIGDQILNLRKCDELGLLDGLPGGPDNPLLPNYKHVPIAYHGRASSIVVSGTAVRRPAGQVKGSDGVPVFQPSARLDYEAEIGCFCGPGNALGQPIPIDAAETHVFGLCLVNDWSARDIQAWEYQPLGPFLAKNFATTVSPWVITYEALAPFRRPATERPSGDPRPLGYLSSPANEASGGFDVTVEVLLRTASMRTDGLAPHPISRTSLRDMYWTLGQMVTHHTSNGCNLLPGDLIATGTVSGSAPGSSGCLLELTQGGSVSLTLPGGEDRTFLADGDEVIMRAFCERAGYARVGFGECTGIIT